MPRKARPSWHLVTNHGLALFYLSGHPRATVREIAAALNVTERRVSSIVRDLTEAGLLNTVRQGRGNRYSLGPDASFRHPLLAHIRIEDFIDLVYHQDADQPRTIAAPSEESFYRHDE
jgi:DNA-binding transcriptional ArsR family regulator